MEYKALLESLGIQTRLGKCSLSVAYEHINEQRAQSYEEEFAALAGFEQSPMLKWIKTMHSKNTLSEEGMVIVEILTEMYKNVLIFSISFCRSIKDLLCPRYPSE